MAKSTTSQSEPSPLKTPLIRRIWLANMVSLLGTTIQYVAAVALMLKLTSSVTYVAYLAMIGAAAAAILTLPAGAVVDILDRRKLLIICTIVQAVTSAVAGFLALSGLVTPLILLLLIAVYMSAGSFAGSAFNTMIPEMVSREKLLPALSIIGSGAAIGSVIGCLIGGIFVAITSPSIGFFLDAVSFIGLLIVFAMWRRKPLISQLPAEHILSAIKVGLRYARNAPDFRSVVLTNCFIIFCTSSLTVLMAPIINIRLHASSFEFGLALAVSGAAAALAGWQLIPRIAKFSADMIAVVGAGLFIVFGLVGAGLIRSYWVILIFLFIASGAITIMSTVYMSALMKSLPEWVRGRGLSVGGAAAATSYTVGAIIWGALGQAIGISVTLILVAILMAVGYIARIMFTPSLGEIEALDLKPVIQWPNGMRQIQHEPLLPDEGPVQVENEYTVPADKLDEFVELIHHVSQLRRRVGAMHWTIAVDVQRHEVHVESYILGSWVEHERERERMTADDEALLERLDHFLAKDEETPTRELVRHHNHHSGKELLEHLHNVHPRRLTKGASAKRPPGGLT